MAKPRENRRKSSLAFPYEPESDRGRFIRFMDESGATQVFIDGFSGLYNEPIKPEDPILWLKDFFKSKAKESMADVHDEMDQLRADIIKVATEYEILNNNISEEKLKDTESDYSIHETRSIRRSFKEKITVDEKYVQEGGDSRWQIKPDPVFRANWSKDEIATQLEKSNKARHHVSHKLSDQHKTDEKSSLEQEANVPPIDEFKDMTVEQPEESLPVIESALDLAEDEAVMMDHSTETSPQTSAHLLDYEEFEAEADEDEEDNVEVEAEVEVEEVETVVIPKPKTLKSKAATKTKKLAQVKQSIPDIPEEVPQVPLPPPPQKSPSPLPGLSPQQMQMPDSMIVTNCDSCITPDFWTQGFSLGKVDVEESDDEDGLFYDRKLKTSLTTSTPSRVNFEILAKAYKPQKSEEFSWLPSILDHNFDLDEYGNEKASRSNGSSPPEKVRESLVFYQFEKKSHGVQQLRRTK